MMSSQNEAKPDKHRKGAASGAPKPRAKAPTKAKAAAGDKGPSQHAKKKLLLTFAVFCKQARTEGRWLEFVSHVHSRYWLKWPVPIGNCAEELAAHVETSKVVSQMDLSDQCHPHEESSEHQKRLALGGVLSVGHHVGSTLSLGEPRFAWSPRV